MIHFDEQIRKIRAASTFDDPWRDPDVQKQVAALHGADLPPEPDDYGDDSRLDGAPNYCGVFTNGERILVADTTDPRNCHGEIKIIQTPAGHWLMSISYQVSWTGGGSSPSIWNREGYLTRDEAIEAGLQSLAAKARSIIEINDSYAESYRRHGNALIEAVANYRASLNQLSLF